MDTRKLDKTRAIIARWLGRATNPIVAWSAGKDSMVLLALVREIAPDTPVMFLRQSGQDHKNAFAERMIAEWNLNAPTFMPLYRDAISRAGKVEIVEAYPAGHGCCFYLPLEGERELDTARPFICGFDRMADPVAGENAYPYDVTFIGHRADDADPMHGDLRPRGESSGLGATVLVYPFYDWTLQDVWDASDALGVPQNEDRYDIVARVERSEMAGNNDYHNMCTRCLAPGHNQRLIACPKTGGNVWYLGDLLPTEQRREFWRERFVNIGPREE